MHCKNTREHDQNIELVMNILNFKRVTPTKQKCQFNLDSIQFLDTC